MENILKVSDENELVENNNIVQIITIHKCRRCGRDFKPIDYSGTNARSFRCNKCLTLKSLTEDILYSCIIS